MHIFLFFLLLVQSQAAVLLDDDFTKPAISSKIWKKNTNCTNSLILFEEGKVLIQNRALLVSPKQWNPTQGCGFSIHGIWRKGISSDIDFFGVSWRTNAVINPSGSCSLFDGVGFYIQSRGDVIHMFGDGNTIVSADRFDFHNDQLVEFWVSDNGNQITARLKNLSTNDTIFISKNVSTPGINNYIVITNREQAGEDFRDYLEEISITTLKDPVWIEDPVLTMSNEMNVTLSSSLVTFDISFPPMVVVSWGDDSFNDTAAVTDIGNYTWSVQELSHRYLTPGFYNITVTLFDRCDHGTPKLFNITLTTLTSAIVTSGLVTSGLVTSSEITPVTSDKSTENSSKSIIIGVSIGVIIFVLLVVAIAVSLLLSFRKKNKQEDHSEGFQLKSLQGFSVDYDEIEFGEKIGNGSFGIVYIAFWKKKTVAVKKLKNDSLDFSSLLEFVQEAEVMIKIPRHPNVVALLGVTKPPKPVVMIAEYCSNGSLKSHLKLYKSHTPITLVKKWLLGSAKGLQHLHKHNFIHRDIAARNILLTEKLDAKISDFGMTRLIQDNQSHHTTISAIGPVKWMAPESINSRSYSPKSDVWSFGVLIYEIIERETPFPNMSNLEAANEVARGNTHVPFPKGIPEIIVQMMEGCFQFEPKERLNFNAIIEMLNLIPTEEEKQEVSLVTNNKTSSKYLAYSQV